MSAGDPTGTPADTVTLWRPVGPSELALIEASGRRAFPPRLPQQPIFYPVLNEEYAAKIARDWNATSAQTGYRGYVTRFRVRADFLASYEVHTVGASWHREYWIPAGALEEFNAAIVGEIEVTAEFHGGQLVSDAADDSMGRGETGSMEPD